jgi:hypothetical protein
MAENERTEIQATTIAGVQDLLKFSEEDKSLAALQEYVIVPFCKVVQGMSDQELKDVHGEGSVILQPGGVKVGGRDSSFLFVPLFFFTEFRKWADRNDKAQMIVESTYDPTSDLAKKARDHESWSEVYEEDIDKDEKAQRKYRYVEHLCFVGNIHSGPQKGTQCMISYQKGDFRVGRSFASGAQMRKVDAGEAGLVQVPLWAQVWEMKVSKRDKNDNQWWGIDPCNPSEGILPVIDPELYPVHNQAYKDLAEAHASNRLRVDGQDNDEESSLESNEF